MIRHVAESQHSLFFGGLEYTESLGKEQIRSRFDLGDGGLFGLGWIKPPADIRDFDFNFGIDTLSTGLKGIDQAVNFANGNGRNNPECIGFCEAAGDDTAKIGWFVNPVVKNREIRSHRAELRAESKGDLRIIFGYPACRFFARKECITHDQVEPSFGILSENFFKISGCYFFGELIFDIAYFLLGFQTGLVDDAVPRLLNRRLKNGCDFKWFCLADGKDRQN